MSETIIIPVKGPGPLVSLDDDTVFHFIFKRTYLQSGLPNVLVLHNTAKDFRSWLKAQQQADIIPSTILLDINMPDINGIDLAAEISTLRIHGSPLNTVILSSSSSRADRERALSVGVQNMLTKPTSIKDYHFVSASANEGGNASEATD